MENVGILTLKRILFFLKSALKQCHSHVHGEAAAEPSSKWAECLVVLFGGERLHTAIWLPAPPPLESTLTPKGRRILQKTLKIPEFNSYKLLKENVRELLCKW